MNIFELIFNHLLFIMIILNLSHLFEYNLFNLNLFSMNNSLTFILNSPQNTSSASTQPTDHFFYFLQLDIYLLTDLFQVFPESIL